MSAAEKTFGTAVKTWRNRLSPVDVALPHGPARRAAGLRREELAALAGVSVDYVVRLEQGRSRNPSAQVVAALARALQLDLAERDHLYRLAGLLPPTGQVSTHIPPGVQRLVGRLGDVPLAVFTADWTLLSWTPLWSTLLGDPHDRPAAEWNLIRLVFSGGAPAPWPVRSSRDDAVLAAGLVADLRSAGVTYPGDADLTRFIEQMRASSPAFARLWDSGAVGAHLSDRKTIDHPAVGELTLDCDILTAHGSDLRIVVYTAATGTPDAEKLDFLRVTAIRAMPV
ncbi:MAG: helix-turn-helix transcriptional regulator [Actinoplanes sp.]